MKHEDVMQIADEFLRNPTNAQIESLIRTVPDTGYDLSKIRTILGLKDKVRVVDVKSAFWESKNVKNLDGCGSCEPVFGIPLVDMYTHRQIQAVNPHEYEIPGSIPLVYMPCPNCSGSQKAHEVLTRMYEDETALTWILLYDFITFQLHQDLQPETFLPGEYWEGIDIEPHLSSGQRKLLQRIQEQQNFAKKQPKTNTIKKLKSVVRGAAAQMTTPF